MIGLLGLCVLSVFFPWAAQGRGSCEPIKIQACRLWGYNETSMPNLASHGRQADAKVEFETFGPLLESGCSKELPFFLCSVYTPMCAPLAPSFLVGPCRPLCQKVRRQCEPLLLKMGFSWPAHFDCSRFYPANREHEMCMKGPDESSLRLHPELPLSTLHTFVSNPLFRETVKNRLSQDSSLHHKYRDYLLLLEADLNMQNPAKTQISTPCRHLKRSLEYIHVEHINSCVPLCSSNILFDEEQKTFAQIWMGAWSGVSLLGVAFTLLTHSLLPQPREFPDKAVIYLTLSYGLSALSYIFRLLVGKEAYACQSLDSDHSISLLTQEGLRNELCAFGALLFYFPSMSGSSWWTVGTLCWCLSAIFNNNNRGTGYAPLYHLIAWGIPAALSIAVLLSKLIDAHELTGMCGVGNQREDALWTYVIIPESIQFALSHAFFAIGLLASLCRDKKENIYSRIALFWILYSLPKGVVLGCDVYEALNRREWRDVTRSGRPNVEIFMLRICMSNVIGLTSAYWIWSKETLGAWRKLGTSCCFGLWRRKKKPSTPAFPTVRYRPQPLGGGLSEATKSQGVLSHSVGSIEFGRQVSLGSSPVVL
eukprot:TRINITY_DN3530_c0_g1_i1.p1 TRINITY_DN3530_c0_g1~~TRINITY_DN3530_c0_g1_i1.p1  ORF type:complete len:593 (-),score=139.83 TRINITY_DN3530_c0_g1_i1:160-1938(-)